MSSLERQFDVWTMPTEHTRAVICPGWSPMAWRTAGKRPGGRSRKEFSVVMVHPSSGTGRSPPRRSRLRRRCPWLRMDSQSQSGVRRRGEFGMPKRPVAVIIDDDDDIQELVRPRFK